MDIEQNPTPAPEWQVQVDRHNDRTEVYHGYRGNERAMHIARRIEATGAIEWLVDLDSDSKAAVVRILAKIPRNVRLNRAQRRRMKAIGRKKGK